MAIGLNIGLRFERESLSRIHGLYTPVLVAVVSVVLACAVLVTALDTGANSTQVFAVQLFRLVVVSAAAPIALRLILGRPY